MEETMEINDAKFTYLVSDHEISDFSNHYEFIGLKVIVNYTKGTDVLTAKSGNKELAVVGFCIDSRAEIEREDVPQAILSVDDSIHEVYCFCNRLAGKYMIIYYDGTHGFIWGDATTSLQINYSNNIELPLCVASTDKMVAETLHCQVSEHMKQIRSGASLSQALPWNVTMYKEISALLPNHYLCISDRKTIRVPLNIRPIQGGGGAFCGCVAIKYHDKKHRTRIFKILSIGLPVDIRL